MKNWLLIPLLSCSLAFPAGAQPNQYERESILLSYDEFSQLTHAEQMTYVKKMREIMINMAGAFPEMAQQDPSRADIYAQMWSMLFGTAEGADAYSADVIKAYVDSANEQAQEYYNAVSKAKTTGLSESEKQKVAEQYRQALYWAASAASQANGISDAKARSEALASLSDTKAKLENIEPKVKAVANEGDYRIARDDYFKKAYQGELTTDAPFPNGALADYGTRLNNSNSRPSNLDKFQKNNGNPAQVPDLINDAVNADAAKVKAEADAKAKADADAKKKAEADAKAKAAAASAASAPAGISADMQTAAKAKAASDAAAKAKVETSASSATAASSASTSGTDGGHKHRARKESTASSSDSSSSSSSGSSHSSGTGSPMGFSPAGSSAQNLPPAEGSGDNGHSWSGKIKPAEKKADDKSAKTADGAGVYYRCMYAGFVIQKHPCVAPEKLPWENVKGLDEGKFACGKGTIMCNPFVFGFKSSCDAKKPAETGKPDPCFADAKPFCVKPGLYATKNCGEVSNSDASLEMAVRLISANPSIFNQFARSFVDLCDKKLINFNSYKGQVKNKARTEADINRTCDAARTRMNEIKKRYALFKEKAKPAAPAGASAPAPAGAPGAASDTKGKK